MAKRKAKITTKGPPLTAVAQQLLALVSGFNFQAGIFEGEGQDLIEYAAINEFGGIGDEGQVIPERSFLRDTLSIHYKKYTVAVNQMIQNLARNMSKAPAPTKQGRGKKAPKMFGGGGLPSSAASEAKALNRMVRDDIVDRIDAGIAPRNAPMTIMIKGFDHPLIHTGRLRAAIQSKITKDDNVPF